MILVALPILAACNRETAQPAAATATAQTTTSAQKADLSRAKVNQTVNTDVVELTTDAHLGNQAGADGVVTAEVSQFKPGEPVILSMVVNQSPGGLEMAAVWKDAKGKILEERTKAMNGGKIATFTYGGPKLKAGSYSVTGYWGGNIAAEKKFTVTR